MRESPEDATRGRAWATPLALLLMPAVAGAFALVAPYVRLSDGWVDFVTFLAPVGAAFAALGVGSLAEPSRRVVLGVLGVAAAALVTVALSGVYSMTLALVVGACLVAIGWGIGLPIGRRVQHPGHLLPACAIAAAADVASVFSDSGPTAAIVESKRALAVLALPFPVLGTNDAVPTLGVGDLVFVGLLLGVAARHGISRWRVYALAIVGALLAGLMSALLEAAVPALPAIGLTALVGIPQARSVPARDRKMAAIAVAAALTIVVATVLPRLVGGNG